MHPDLLSFRLESLPALGPDGRTARQVSARVRLRRLDPMPSPAEAQKRAWAVFYTLPGAEVLAGFRRKGCWCQVDVTGTDASFGATDEEVVPEVVPDVPLFFIA
jgi:hypothetical protein